VAATTVALRERFYRGKFTQLLCSTATVLDSIRMEKATNITVKVDATLARDAKVLAARRGTSLSRLVADQLAALVNDDQVYAVAKRRALRRLKRGYDLGWKAPADREVLHNRESLR